MGHIRGRNGPAQRIPRPSSQRGIPLVPATVHTDFDEHGAPIRVSGIFRDVTARRKAEEEAERLSERLLVLQDEERKRIAEELHNSTAQHLLAIGLNLNTLRSRVAAKGETVKLFEEIGSSLDETSKELRSFTYLLRPPRLESDGLAATLQRYLEGFSQRTGLKTKLRLNGSVDRVPLPLQQAVLRIVQEALTNVHRHAAATSVSINLRFVGKLMHLVINDDGLGMEGASGGRQRQPIRLGVGVPGMRGPQFSNSAASSRYALALRAQPYTQRSRSTKDRPCGNSWCRRSRRPVGVNFAIAPSSALGVLSAVPRSIDGKRCQNRLSTCWVQAPTVWLDCHRLLRFSAAAVRSLRSGVGIIFLRAARRHFPVRSLPVPTIWREYLAGTGRLRERIGDEPCRRVHRTQAR